jgi:thiamine-phosphate diphosphorylase
MFQFVTDPKSRYSITEQVQMGIEGGCQWIQIDLDTANADDARETVMQCAELCREAGVILTVEDREDVASATEIHGVHITDPTRSAVDLRAQLGAEAMIGITLCKAEDIIALHKKDIDYVSLPADMSEGDARAIIDAVRAAGVEIPIVVTDASADNLVNKIATTGASGVRGGQLLVHTDDPAGAIADLQTRLAATR